MKVPLWKSMPEYVPTNGQVVWVRRMWYSAPSLATWTLAAQTFTYASGLVLPWWAVGKWRAQA